MKKETKKNLKTNKFKEFINWFKESWSVPRKRAGLKLLGYLVFFFIFFIIAGVGNKNSYNNVKNNKNTLSTTTTTILDTETYSYKQKLLLENKHFINYEITLGEESYKINGSLDNNVLEGYLESSDGIKKIKLENGVLYEINDSESLVLETTINLGFIDIQKIVNIIKSSRAYIEENEDVKTYTYNLNIENNISTFKVYTADNIYKIEINSDIYSYKLVFE